MLEYLRSWFVINMCNAYKEAAEACASEDVGVQRKESLEIPFELRALSRICENRSFSLDPQLCRQKAYMQDSVLDTRGTLISVVRFGSGVECNIVVFPPASGVKFRH